MIPDKALDAAARALDRHHGVTSFDPDCIREVSEEMAAILEAAAPFIRAEALREFAAQAEEEKREIHNLCRDFEGRTFPYLVSTDAIRRRADELDPQ